MNIGLYFGSYNPIHIGHLIIGSHVANHTDIQQVWMVVSPHNPLKHSSVLLNEYHRLHLVQLAVGDDPQLKASDVEFKLPRPSYTIDTLTYLSEKYPQHRFSIIMGSDSFQNLPRWKNYEMLLKNYSFIIYLRPGYEITESYAARIQILDAPLLEISATEVRHAIKAGKSVRYLLTDSVREEIEKTGYYK
jgi:nicotinate-nucleotide adenylyltransferase